MKKGIFIGIGIMIAVAAGLWFSGLVGIRYPGAYDAFIETYKDDFNQQVRTLETVSAKADEVKRAYYKADSLRTKTEKELVFAKQEIKALNIKLKNARSFTSIETTVKDSFTVKFDTVYLENEVPILNANYTDGYMHQKINYKPYRDILTIKYSITDTVMVVDSWIRKPNKKGEQVFILWRWLKPWQVKVDIKSKNPKSNITNGNRTILNTKKR